MLEPEQSELLIIWNLLPSRQSTTNRSSNLVVLDSGPAYTTKSTKNWLEFSIKSNKPVICSLRKEKRDFREIYHNLNDLGLGFAVRGIPKHSVIIVHSVGEHFLTKRDGKCNFGPSRIA